MRSATEGPEAHERVAGARIPVRALLPSSTEDLEEMSRSNGSRPPIGRLPGRGVLRVVRVEEDTTAQSRAFIHWRSSRGAAGDAGVSSF
jgi:hypothetical protein